MIFAKLEKLSRREKLGLTIGMLCIFVLLADKLVVQSIIGRFKQLDMDVERAKKNLFYNRRVLEAEDKIRQKYENISQLLGTVSSPAEEMDKMNEGIVNLASQTGVACPSMESLPPRQSDFYEEYRVEIGKFEADMTNLLGFLHELRMLPGILRVSKLNLSPNKGKGKVKGSMLISKIMGVELESAMQTP